MALEFTDDNFEKEVLKSDQVVLVDFWAPWCGPCQMMGPVIDELHDDVSGSFKIGKLNVDESPDTASKYEVMSIPTIKIFKGGEVVKEFTGVQDKDLLKSELESL